MENKYVNFFELKGKRLKYISITLYKVLIVTDEGVYLISHHQDCCEIVRLHKLIVPYEHQIDLNDSEAHTAYYGDYRKDDFIITLAEDDHPDLQYSNYHDFSHTWTRFKLELSGGKAYEILFLGESNGYYSEDLTIEKIL